MVNIGQLIKEELEKQGRSAGWLAKELHCNRSTVYRALGCAMTMTIKQI